tara:strand:- start:431 stop:925 length:495 start_codon:yes stop_codon:yes gene_type:complete
MKRSSPLTLKILLFLSVFLNSCGYELRTYSSSLSNQAIHFEGDNSDLSLDLKNKLKEMNNIPRANDKNSDLKIKILDHSIDKYVGSTGMGARTTQVRLDYKLVYEIEKNDNTYKQTYEEMSFVDFNQSDLLAFEGEVEALQDIFIARALRNMEFFLSTKLNEVK